MPKATLGHPRRVPLQSTLSLLKGLSALVESPEGTKKHSINLFDQMVYAQVFICHPSQQPREMVVCFLPGFHPPYNILNATCLAFHAFPYLMVYPKKSFTSSFMSFSFMIGSFRILLMNLYAMNEEVS
jgi:hypothetical protein